jgi:hypothetical protein
MQAVQSGNYCHYVDLSNLNRRKLRPTPPNSISEDDFSLWRSPAFTYNRQTGASCGIIIRAVGLWSESFLVE